MARESGYSDFDMTVSQIDPWVTTITNLHGLNDISIEEIKARCLEETHLEPPVSPTFLKQ